MITLRIKLYKEKPDGSIDYTEPRFHPRNQMVLFEIDNIEDRLNIAFGQIQEALEKWTSNGSGWIVDRMNNYHFEISTFEGRFVYRTTEIHKHQKKHAST